MRMRISRFSSIHDCEWLGREKHVLETKSNSLSERITGNTSPTTASVVMSWFRKLTRKHATK